MNLNVNADNNNNAAAGVPVGGTYEDMVTYHLDVHQRHCGHTVNNTELTRRVAEWQQRIQAEMQHQEHRRLFDVHLYGQVCIVIIVIIITLCMCKHVVIIHCVCMLYIVGNSG